jgi:gamma-glutamyl-gamma-aminobutyraldehyde dehydrogenase
MPFETIQYETDGPLVTKADQQRVLSIIETGKSEGARLVFGGNAPEALEPGAFVNPTLFSDVDNRMTIAREEIFGPVACVIPFDGPEEAIHIANDTIYGLAASIWTKDIDKAFHLVRNIESGIVWVNTFDAGDFTQPFGGYKQSGNARDKCIDSYKSYTQTKSAWIQLSTATRATRRPNPRGYNCPRCDRIRCRLKPSSTRPMDRWPG